MRRIIAFAEAAVLVLGLNVVMVPPVWAQAVSEPPTVVEGTLSVLVEDDFAHGRANKRHFLDEAGSGGHHEIKLAPHQAATLQPGTKVRVKGRFRGGMLSADAPDESVDILAAPTTPAPVSARKVLILLVDIVDSLNVKHAISANCDGATDEAATIAFGFNNTSPNVDACYQDGSYGKLGFGGASYPGTDVDVQRVTISADPGSCNFDLWGSKADALARNLSNYQHRLYVVPSDVSCGWAGVAYLASCPGSLCQAWVKAYGYQECGYIDAMAHEVGHNIGLMHSSFDTNNDGNIDCEYCDDQDFMGYAEGMLRPLSGPHRVQMGYISGAGIVDAGGGGQFTLAPLSQWAPSLPQVAKLTPAIGYYPYYVSYRVASGYDSYIASTAYSPGVLNGISIHRFSGGSTNTLFVTSLDDGQVFIDAINGISITQNSHTADSVTFTVSTDLLAPANVWATAGDTQVALSWTASSGASGYNVKRADALAGPYTPLAPNVTGTSYLDTAVVNGQTYFYVVSALRGADESLDSAPVSATPNVVRPDLIVTALGIPTSAVAGGSAFKVTDTVKNQGAIAAGASTNRYYLSLDQNKDGSDVLLSGTGLVSSLGVGQTTSHNLNVTLPSTVPAGAYYVLSCADDLNSVPESSETNNCRASAGTLQIALADLVVTAITIPTAPAAGGGTFKVTDTVKNQGTVTAVAFTRRYYLSADASKDAGDILLGGSVLTSSLSAGQTSNGNVTVTIPAATPLGTYYVLSCADDLNTVVESNESNNCKASASRLQVTRSDLVITALTNPPTSAAVGGTFRLTDTAKNLGTVAATASTTRYYLSADAQRDPGDRLLTGSRSISSLNAGSSSSSNVNVTIAAGTVAGTYYLLACADDAAAVAELDETNNCRASAGTVVVH